MAGNLIISAVTADLHSPVSASPSRVESKGAERKTGASGPGQTPEEPPLEDPGILEAHLTHARETITRENTTLSFERDAEDGRMYLHIRDKRTGEELERIPKSYLKNIPHILEFHQLDVRV